MAKVQTNRTPEVLEKYEEVVRLRTLGLSFQMIADRVGYAGRSGAKEAYSQAIKMWGGEAVDELRVIENERLDHLHRVLMAQLETTTRDPETGAGEIVPLVNSALNLARRRAALNGLDSASKHEISGPDGSALQTDVGEMLRQRLQAFEKETDIKGVITPPNPPNNA